MDQPQTPAPADLVAQALFSSSTTCASSHRSGTVLLCYWDVDDTSPFVPSPSPLASASLAVRPSAHRVRRALESGFGYKTHTCILRAAASAQENHNALLTRLHGLLYDQMPLETGAFVGRGSHLPFLCRCHKGQKVPPRALQSDDLFIFYYIGRANGDGRSPCILRPSHQVCQESSAGGDEAASDAASTAASSWVQVSEADSSQYSRIGRIRQYNSNRFGSSSSSSSSYYGTSFGGGSSDSWSSRRSRFRASSPKSRTPSPKGRRAVDNKPLLPARLPHVDFEALRRGLLAPAQVNALVLLDCPYYADGTEAMQAPGQELMAASTGSTDTASNRAWPTPAETNSATGTSTRTQQDLGPSVRFPFSAALATALEVSAQRRETINTAHLFAQLVAKLEPAGRPPTRAPLFRSSSDPHNDRFLVEDGARPELSLQSPISLAPQQANIEPLTPAEPPPPRRPGYDDDDDNHHHHLLDPTPRERARRWGTAGQYPGATTSSKASLLRRPAGDGGACVRLRVQAADGEEAQVLGDSLKRVVEEEAGRGGTSSSSTVRFTVEDDGVFLQLPVRVWYCLRHHPAIECVGFVQA